MRRWLFAAGALCTIIVQSHASAQSDPATDRLREQLRAATLQLRELQSVQDALTAAKLAAEKERDELKRKAGAETSAAQVRQLQAALSEAKSRSQSLQGEQDKLQQDLAQVRTDLLAVQAERDAARREAATTLSTLTATTTQLGTCSDRNHALFGIANEILDRYQTVGLFESLGRKEPFIGLKRVQLENAAQAFGDRLHDNVYRKSNRQAQSPAVHPAQ